MKKLNSQRLALCTATLLSACNLGVEASPPSDLEKVDPAGQEGTTLGGRASNLRTLPTNIAIATTPEEYRVDGYFCVTNPGPHKALQFGQNKRKEDFLILPLQTDEFLCINLVEPETGTELHLLARVSEEELLISLERANPESTGAFDLWIWTPDDRGFAGAGRVRLPSGKDECTFSLKGDTQLQGQSLLKFLYDSYFNLELELKPAS